MLFLVSTSASGAHGDSRCSIFANLGAGEYHRSLDKLRAAPGMSRVAPEIRLLTNQNPLFVLHSNSGEASRTVNIRQLTFVKPELASPRLLSAVDKRSSGYMHDIGGRYHCPNKRECRVPSDLRGKLSWVFPSFFTSHTLIVVRFPSKLLLASSHSFLWATEALPFFIPVISCQYVVSFLCSHCIGIHSLYIRLCTTKCKICFSFDESEKRGLLGKDNGK